MLRDSVVVAVVCTRPRAIPLAMITMRKSTHGFPFLSYMSMGLRLAALWAAGAPLLRINLSCHTFKFLHFGPHSCCRLKFNMAARRSINSYKEIKVLNQKYILSFPNHIIQTQQDDGFFDENVSVVLLIVINTERDARICTEVLVVIN